MPDVLKATDVEVRIVHLLRARIEKAISENGSEWAAAKLDISLPGVEAILWRHDWSVGTAVHLAGLLGVLTDSDLDKLDDTQPVAS